MPQAWAHAGLDDRGRAALIIGVFLGRAFNIIAVIEPVQLAVVTL